MVSGEGPGAGLHRRVAEQLAAEIQGGRWAAGSALPAEVDLCKTYGVSRSTVREAMRALEALGYVRRRRGSGTFVLPRAAQAPPRAFVGLVVAHLNDLRLSEVLRGLTEVLSEAGVGLEVRATEDHPQAEGAAVEALRERGAAAILVEPAPGWPSRPLFQRCLDERFPVVFLDRADPDLPVPHVVSDNFRGGMEATRHLLACGHLRIGFLLPRAYPTTSVDDRLRGHRSALTDGCGADAVDPSLAVRMEGNLLDPLDESLRAAVNALLARPAARRPTALMCANDEVASWAMAVLKEAGMRIPQDCSVVGFDDLSYSRHLDPPLTTVRQPLTEIGRVAAERVLGRLAQPDAAIDSAVLPVRLVVRRSTGRPPAGPVA